MRWQGRAGQTGVPCTPHPTSRLPRWTSQSRPVTPAAGAALNPSPGSAVPTAACARGQLRWGHHTACPLSPASLGTSTTSHPRPRVKTPAWVPGPAASVFPMLLCLSVGGHPFHPNVQEGPPARPAAALGTASQVPPGRFVHSRGCAATTPPVPKQCGRPPHPGPGPSLPPPLRSSLHGSRQWSHTVRGFVPGSFHPARGFDAAGAGISFLLMAESLSQVWGAVIRGLSPPSMDIRPKQLLVTSLLQTFPVLARPTWPRVAQLQDPGPSCSTSACPPGPHAQLAAFRFL